MAERARWWSRLGGVRLRSALAAACVVAVAVVVAGLIFVATARSTLTDNVDAAAALRADEAAVALQAGEDPLEEVRPDPNDQALIQILDPSGAVIAASPELAAVPPITAQRPAPGQRRFEERTIPVSDDDPFRILSQGVATSGGDRIVVVAQSRRPINESIELVTRSLLVGMPLLVLVVGLATFVFVGRSLRPVESIRRRVATITGRDLHARVPVPAARDEVAALAETMNGMLDRLESAADAQRRFVADASHELRSPLATIQVGLDLLLAADSAHRTQLQRMRGEAERLGRLVGDLLLLARVDEHGLTLRRADVDLDDIAYRERDRLIAQHPHLAVHARIDPVRIGADAHQLERAVRNIVDNAARHARSRITIVVRAARGSAYLLVGDDGPGVPPAQRQRIFDRFVRLDDARTRGDGGSGLGLPIAREIVTAHGGDITVTGEVPGLDHGGGAVLQIRLPLPAAEADHTR
ncbi:ATP-binding protein [Phytohabitans flavus]|uniref:histidine kinase n=1 Tax=Phytohabitans flavus TaxID=1076124 RepID=A0A6F8XNE5_9ACTN|nr:HAMP domain-containing sensor histidine kinase [Phytohabitans flavus]BCB75288.1 two-component sensor histidine kinase [Phytohabitans flavus]